MENRFTRGWNDRVNVIPTSLSWEIWVILSTGLDCLHNKLIVVSIVSTANVQSNYRVELLFAYW